MLVAMVSASGCGDIAHSPPQPSKTAHSPSATVASSRFLARYVTSDGRVIRHDQGGDIVSEGQAYGMLIAQVADQPALVRTIWSWTAGHLMQPDGLFAWHATGSGQIEDPQSATDADILIAYALLRYAGPDQAALRGAGRRVAQAVLANESVDLPDGAPVLVAGPWARAKSPPVVDPSYLMPSVYDALARLTGDGRWRIARVAAVRLIGELTDSGRRLPPDWAQLSGDRLVPIPAPSGGAGAQYGLDAARVPIWFATACDAGARKLAGNWWRYQLESHGRSGQTALSIDGAPINPQTSPVTLVAAAAAATAAGDQNASRQLRLEAESLALRTPTYYGDAWAALGPALLDGAIDPCARAGSV
jgi:endoglucanase